MDGSGSSNPPGHSTAEIGGQAQGHGVAGDSIVLEEEIDPNYVPTQVKFKHLMNLHVAVAPAILARYVGEYKIRHK